MLGTTSSQGHEMMSKKANGLMASAIGQDWVSDLAQTFIKSLRKLLNLIESQFPHLQDGDNKNTQLRFDDTVHRKRLTRSIYQSCHTLKFPDQSCLLLLFSLESPTCIATLIHVQLPRFHFVGNRELDP